MAAFSFQIADRSAALESPLSGIWPGGIGIDSFKDLVASKMVALVERGAPRDLLDIYTLCHQGQCTIHLLRKWHELPPLPYLGNSPAYIRDDPFLKQV